MRTILTLGLISLIGAGGFYGYREWLGPKEPPKYKSVEVGRGDLIATVSATGAIEPLLKVVVGSQVSGTVTKWYADFNDRVTENMVLAELDRDRFQAALQQRTASVAVARARVEEAQAKLAEATLDQERIRNAFQRAAASDFELQSAIQNETALRAALHAAEAQVEAAEADRRQAEVELSKTIIRSPIDGIVISRDVDAGQTVAASLSSPTLFTIANDLSKMRVNAAVSETDIGAIRDGMAVEFRVDAYPGRKYRGVVAQVRFKENVVDNVVTYTTLIDVENEDLSLRPGMTATVQFETAKAEDVLRVPNQALRFDPNPQAAPASGGGFWGPPARGHGPARRVFKLVGAELIETPLELGLSDGAFTEVKSGDLKLGDLIVTELDFSAGRTSSSGRPMAQRIPRGM